MDVIQDDSPSLRSSPLNQEDGPLDFRSYTIFVFNKDWSVNQNTFLKTSNLTLFVNSMHSKFSVHKVYQIQTKENYGLKN